MASIIYSPKDIYEHEFKQSMRGYDKAEVDEFLDDIIKDYENYMTQLQDLRRENGKLKQQLAAKPKTTATQTSSYVSSSPDSHFGKSATNIDILKRISRLEKEVFGKQIRE